ncbi:hypothetical protein BGZ76_001307 [Entomortierella beljakovae]|nr:hypothetical protein BGZ76_001307 [Entomortierella beljakovae]
MTSSLDMSLADIIKTQKASRPPRGNQKSRATGPTRNSKTTGPTRNTRGSRDKKPYTAGAQQYKATPVAPLHTSVIRQSAPDGSKIQISNLDLRVTADDLKLVFSSRVGPLKKCSINYDQNGKSNGTALVHFTRVTDAAVAVQKFNGVPLDGRAMKIELVVAPGAAAVTPAAGQSNSGRQGQQKRTPVKAGRPGRGRGNNSGSGSGSGRGRGRGGRGEKKETKTADQLDAEMSSYMQVDA